MLRSGPSLLFVLLLSALLAACGDEAETPAEVLTGSPSATSTTPGLGPGTLVFLRGDADPAYPLTGSIWITNLTGADARQVTPEGVTASYVGRGASKFGGTLLYYATRTPKVTPPSTASI